jgi:hypothetical protein
VEQIIHLSYQIDPIWDIVKQIREQVVSALAAYSEDLRQASQMTASELMENAVKYGTRISDAGGIDFELTATALQIMIVVSNRILAQEDYHEVQRHIDLLNAPGANPEALYLNRLQALMTAEHSGEKTQLGLFRIVYEGQFTLHYHFEQEILTIRAIREL